MVVVPSRELGMQVVRAAHDVLPPEAKGVVQQLIGGANPQRQVRPTALHCVFPSSLSRRGACVVLCFSADGASFVE
jgi:hypothetical protein